MNDVHTTGLPFKSSRAAPQPHHYTAFGLTFSSDIRFDELTRVDPCVADIEVRRGAIDLSEAAPGRSIRFDFDRDEYLFCWKDVANFRIRGTDSVLIDPSPECDETMLAFPFLGPVIALLLHLRGKLVLHASCVAVAGLGVSFLGAKMAGKSTTAGAFVRAGYPLLSDDVVALDLDGNGGASVAPAFGQIKLAPDSSDALALGAQIMTDGDRKKLPKQAHRIAGALASAEVPMSRICILERGDTAAMHLMSPEEALPELLCHSYVNRFGRSALPSREKTLHMTHCARVLSEIPVYRLTVPTGLDRLSEAVGLVRSEMTEPTRAHASG